jgi:putative redox protein
MKTVSVALDAAAGRFVALGSHRGEQISVNAPKLPGEQRGPTGFSATELLLAAAGACSAWDVVEIVRKRRHEISALEVTVEGEQSNEPPWQYERIALHFRISGVGLRRGVLQRVIRLSCVRYCSVLATVKGVSRIEATLELVDAQGVSGGRQPVSLAIEPAEPVEEELRPPTADEAG